MYVKVLNFILANKTMHATCKVFSHAKCLVFLSYLGNYVLDTLFPLVYRKPYNVQGDKKVVWNNKLNKYKVGFVYYVALVVQFACLLGRAESLAAKLVCDQEHFFACDIIVLFCTCRGIA